MVDYNGQRATVRPLRLVQLSDTHLGADPATALNGVNTLASLRRVLQHLRTRENGVDAILATGDLAQDGSAQAYAQLQSCLDELALPVYCIPGNHDDPQIMNCSLPGHYLHIKESISIGNWFLALLNTHDPGKESGRLGAERLERLSELLRAHADKFVVLVLHHPPLAIGSPWMDRMGLVDAGALHEVINDTPQVRAVLWGHVHQEFAACVKGVHFLAVPSTCVQFKPGATHYECDPLPPGYRWLELYPDGRVKTGVERVSPQVEGRLAT